MEEKTKEEELKQKLQEYFEKRLTDLTSKFKADIDTIETIKYDYVDNVIKKFQEIEDEHKKMEEEEKERQEKEKQDKEKEKKAKEAKPEKIVKKKIDPKNRPKTPMAVSKNRTKIKDAKSQDISEIHKEKRDAKVKTSTRAPVVGKTPIPKKTDNMKRPVTGKVDSKTRTGNKKGVGTTKKVDPKKGKKDVKKTNKDKKEEEKKEEPVEQPKEEEKKPVIITPKYIYTVSEDMKKSNGLSSIYFVLKGKYIDDKKKFLNLSTFSPILYKSFGSSMKFLLDDKKKEVQNKANEIENFLNNYGDLNTYLTKEFSLSKKAMNSIQFFKQKEEEEILKMAEIPKEVGMLLKCIYLIVDENYEETMNNKELFENMLKNILTKNDDKTFKSLLVNYFNKNKYLNLTKEKYDKINNLINQNNTILNMIAITKMCRPISLFCFMIKEVYDYINLKTLDGQFYFDLRQKNEDLQKYKDFLYFIENNGKPRVPPAEAQKEEEQSKTAEITKNEETKNQEQINKEEIKGEDAGIKEGGENLE